MDGDFLTQLGTVGADAGNPGGGDDDGPNPADYGINAVDFQFTVGLGDGAEDGTGVEDGTTDDPAGKDAAKATDETKGEDGTTGGDGEVIPSWGEMMEGIDWGQDGEMGVNGEDGGTGSTAQDAPASNGQDDGEIKPSAETSAAIEAVPMEACDSLGLEAPQGEQPAGQSSSEKDDGRAPNGAP